MLLYIYIYIYWFLLHVVSLVGQSAPPEVLQKLTYLVLRHHPQIKRVDTVRAYTFGVLYFVEVSHYSTPQLCVSCYFLQAPKKYFKNKLS
jgi:divalent metal cation (Fe/Co/Zn/Cd) transporter